MRRGRAAQAFEALLGAKREAAEDVDQVVRDLIAEVRAEGDAALIRISQKFDRVDLGAVPIVVAERR